VPRDAHFEGRCGGCHGAGSGAREDRRQSQTIRDSSALLRRATESCACCFALRPVVLLPDSRFGNSLLAINPSKRIRALFDGDVTLFESIAINLYLAKFHSCSSAPKR